MILGIEFQVVCGQGAARHIAQVCIEVFTALYLIKILRITVLCSPCCFWASCDP